MAATEKRFPRAAFTKKLTRICERLDACNTHTLSFKHWFFDRPQSATSTATALWVVGSYARGALECGDLDLVVEVHSVGDEPPERKLMSALCGAPPFVRCYAGTPVKNSSGIEFPNPVLIWTGPGCNWRAPLDSIVPDPTAGRAKRPIDALPFRVDQLDTHVEQLEELLKLRRKGIIEWNFIAFDQKSLVPMSSDDFEESEELVARLLELERFSRRILRLLPPVVRAMRKVEPNGNWDSSFGRRTKLWCNGTLLRLGRPSASTYQFDDDPKLHQLGIVPHLSVRGPNGVWLIRRGRNHPDILALAKAKAFYLVAEGIPFIVTWIDDERRYTDEIEMIELFVTREDALQGGEDWQEGFEAADRINFDIAEASGSALLKLVSLVDVVRVGETELALNYRGAAFARLEKPSTIADIVTALPSTSN